MPCAHSFCTFLFCSFVGVMVVSLDTALSRRPRRNLRMLQSRMLYIHNVQLPPSEPRIVAPVSGHRGGARSTGRERNWSYELTSATATGGLICQFVACYELCAIATQRSGRRSKWLQPQKCSALTRAAQSDQAWNESKRGETGSEF